MDVRRFLLVSFSFILFGLPARAADQPLLVCFGDSITAGRGLDTEQAYPAALQRDLYKLGYHYIVSNKGTSGATTKDALASVRSIIRMHPAVVIVEFGGNDGLRGFPLNLTRNNLDAVLAALQGAHIKILLAGITLPPNFGPDYIRQFDAIFPAVAAKHHAAIVPMIYVDLVNVPGTIQQDGIHPTAVGSEIIANTLLPALKPLLNK